MAIPTLISTVGGATANSFGTRQEADDYFDTVLHADAPWPSNVASSATLGSGTNGVVTAVVDVVGTSGNVYTLVAVLGSGANVALSAALVVNAITVTLGTDASSVADDTKNKAILVAAVITALAGVTASYSGTGSTRIPVTTVKTFSGGTFNEETKLPALIMAAQQLTSLVDWTGYVTASTQRLPWPRTGMMQRNGIAFVASGVIPEEVKAAQFELARLLVLEDRTTESSGAATGLTYLRAGSVTMKFRDFGDLSAKVLTSVVWDLLVPSWYLGITGQITGNRELERA